MSSLAGKFDSGRQDWETPQWLFDRLNKEFNFTLDAAANYKNAKCTVFLSDSLNVPWRGTVWLNPPYGNGNLRAWVKKAHDEADADRAVVVMLIPARTNTNWWHTYCMRSSIAEIRFIRGRPKFGGAKHGLPQPLAVVVFGAGGGNRIRSIAPPECGESMQHAVCYLHSGRDEE